MNLIEISISIAICAIIGCLGVVSFKSIRDLQRSAIITQSLQQSLYFAREQAVLRYQNIVISPRHNQWQNGWDIQLDSAHSVLKSFYSQPMEIIFVPFQKSTNVIKIFSDGTSNGYQGHFEYGSTQFVINRGGRGRINNQSPRDIYF